MRMTCKAVFLDYSGTAVNIVGKEMKEMAGIILKALHGSEDPHVLVHYWFERLNAYEEACCGENYEDEDALVYKVLGDIEKKYDIVLNKDQLHDLNQQIWRTAPVFDDTRPFFEKIGLPVYVLTNNTASYVRSNLLRQDIRPAGVISADDVKAFKPHPPIFLEALKQAGVKADEAVHIGDSLQGDVIGACACGLQAVHLDRSGKTEAGEHELNHDGSTFRYTVIHSLKEMIQ